MIERFKKDLGRMRVPEEVVNIPSFEYVFSELVELYNRFQDGEITVKAYDLYYRIEFENEDDLVLCNMKYSDDNTRFKFEIIGGKTIIVTADKPEDELIKYASEKNDEIQTVETSIYSLSNGLEKKYVRDSSGYKDGETYLSMTRLEREDNGYIGEIYKTESPNGEGLSGYVNVDLSSPLLLDSNHERFDDVSAIPSETVRDGISVPADSSISPEARQMIESKLASIEDKHEWENNYKSGLKYNTFNVGNTIKF